MSSVFRYEKDAENIVTITMDMPGTVNAINALFAESLGNCISRLESENSLIGVVIASAKKTFVAGGDLNDFIAAKAGDEEKMFYHTEGIKSLFRRLEKLPVPIVAAINGTALGGGLELALSCNYRIAVNSPAVKVGLPEVGLGLLPGGGGVVRLTCLVGFQSAFPYLMEGKKLDAGKALLAGFVDQLVDEQDALLPMAKEWIKGNPSKAVQPWDERGFAIPGGDDSSASIRAAIAVASAGLYKKTRGLLPAPEFILNIMVEVLRVGFDTALKIESRKFAELVTRPEAKNMINAFFFQMNKVSSGEGRPDGFEKTSVSKLGVLGGGMMGQGIAMVAAKAGISVVIKDISSEAAAKAKAYSEKAFGKLVAKGRMTEEAAATALSCILPSADDADLEGCDFIIEAVFENVELKNKLTSSLEGMLADDGVWASNTSTLPISRLATVSANPSNFIGMHFFSPVDRMPLLEIICGEKTSDETLAKAFDLARLMKKIPIVVNDAPGFYTSRTISTPIQEAAQLMAEGVNPIRVENIGRSVGWPIGPLALQDEVSQKLSLDIIDAQLGMGLRKAEDDPTPEGTALMRRLLTEFDRGGRAHGGGYYEYDGKSKKIWPQLSELYFNGEIDAAVSDKDVFDRLLFRPVIESLICLETGVLRSVADANIGSLMGIGAPAWTGGYLQFVNTYGLEKFVARCGELTDRYGARFRAPSIVLDKLEKSDIFN